MSISMNSTPSTVKPKRQYVLKGSHYAPDLAWQPLSKEQRQGLAMLAKRAFEKSSDFRLRTSDFDTWRREQSIKAVGKRITEAGQRDFLRLRAHFLDLAGQSGAALNVLLKAENEPQRIALHKLTRECSQRGLPLAYPEAICKRQYRCTLAEASAQQIWRLVFTVRNRRKPATPKHHGQT